MRTSLQMLKLSCMTTCRLYGVVDTPVSAMEGVTKIEAPWWLDRTDLLGVACCAAPAVCFIMLIAIWGSRIRRSAQRKGSSLSHAGLSGTHSSKSPS